MLQKTLVDEDLLQEIQEHYKSPVGTDLHMDSTHLRMDSKHLRMDGKHPRVDSKHLRMDSDRPLMNSALLRTEDLTAAGLLEEVPLLLEDILEEVPLLLEENRVVNIPEVVNNHPPKTSHRG